MARFELIEHMADVGVRAWGASLGELFGNAAAGMVEVALDPVGVEELEQRWISAEAPDREALLVNFLGEVLWLLDGERWLPRRVQVERISDREVSAVAHGEPADASRHEMRLIIKAVTYHEISVRQDAGGWRAEFYLDV